MKYWKQKLAFLFIMLFFTINGLYPKALYGNVDICESGISLPAFFATGVDPNLLLLIDNSASMYDLAYVDEQKYCFDDSYDESTTYAGYFEDGTWYYYDKVIGQFEIKNWLESLAIWFNASGTPYNHSHLHIKIDSGTDVTSFFAKGNFLNWATASKFDIEKKILTGGKYEASGTYGAPNGRLVMESRGCLNRRFIKKVPVSDVYGAQKYLTLGIRPPQEERFDPWANGTYYPANSIVSDFGELYKTSIGGTSSGTTGVSDDTGVNWAPYTLTRWTNGTHYPAGSIVSDNGAMYITDEGGTANGTSAANDTGVNWVGYNVTHIEIFGEMTNGFDNSDCQLAVEELGKESPNQGQLKQYIDGCMGYSSGGGQSEEADSQGAFNHSIHNCWYQAKQGSWPPGAGPAQSVMNDCEHIYNTWGTDPWDITTDDRGYVCFGVYDDDMVTEPNPNPYGYVGRCWNPGEGSTCECDQWWNEKNWPDGHVPPDPECCKKWDCSGGTEPGWVLAADGSIDVSCIEQALMDYCNILTIPEVVDPTDQAGETGEFWNIPAVLSDSGVIAQLDEPIAVLKGYIKHEDSPAGLIHEFAEDLRLGSMTFNYDGSDSECSMADPYILYACSDPENRDGGKVISYIDKSSSHTDDLVEQLNKIKAASWTPIAETMYNAIGYYTQNINLRLHPDDFLIDATHPDPITIWCQNNNILIITDGASTADLNNIMKTFASSEGNNDTDNADAVSCPSLSSSTLLDDLTYYANHGENIYPNEPWQNGNKQNITTHIVVAGTLRTTGTNNECSPDILLDNAAQNGGTSLYQAENPSELEAKLREAFSAIRAGAAAGSAASVISSSRTGEGAIYQAIFWPKVESPSSSPVVWTGEVHALFIDEYGNMYEDTNDDKTLDEGDLRVIFYYDYYARTTKVCYGSLNEDGTCNGTSKGLGEVHFLWSASEWLASISDGDILTNRANFISNELRRYIFTWNDLDNDGVTDVNELLGFTAKGDWISSPLSVSGGRGSIPLDFGVQTSAEVDEIVNWVRGLDQTGMRSRQVEADFDHDGTPSSVTWRIGDVVHSTPMLVARPVENYHLIYRDASYGEFKVQYNNRRHVIYFGANDGMFHAVNGGFYNEDQRKFCRTDDCTSEDVAPELGAELWAYVPYNILPHLKCLTNPVYAHKYFIDLRPRIFDVQIFPNDALHPGGWGTILVGGMRFGGATIFPGSLDLDNDSTADYPSDTRKLASTYFILDITDPENPPILLGELTHTSSGVNFGYTTAIPTVVPMKDGANISWYLILGSGPTGLDGSSTQTAKVAVFPLSSLVGSSNPFQIPYALPSSTDERGCFELTAPNSFVSDLITVDYDLNHDYKADVVYFGTVEGTWGSWEGNLYRLITRKEDANGIQEVTVPSQWNSMLASPLTNPLPLIETAQPITGAPSVGSDGKNFWVYFGTGRFFDASDKSDSSQQSYYGIKEPRDCDGNFTWETVEITGTPDSTPGAQGLLRVDQILVHKAATGTDAALSCIGGGTACLPSGVTTFNELVEYIVGAGCSAVDLTGTDGWYKNFIAPRERNLGQAALLGGLLTFTTYQPYDDICLSEGLSYLYGVYYQTGTAWHETVFGDDDIGLDENQNVIDRLDLGHGMATTPSLHVGKQKGSKAFVQTSTGTVIEIPQPNLPIKNIKTGRVSWIELTE
ncbi:MAG: PilC/PilY family type IV pilus protein [Thermodesulfobacteriota bacterium]|nr:PilC/PilY family type IV pilus protein [Thermodesulfobacteriota bacterium]